MPTNYNINKTDGSFLVAIPQGTVQERAGLSLIGKNYVAFGEAFNENLVHLAENFASTVPPTNSLIGQLWFDKSQNKLKVNLGGISSEDPRSPFKTVVTGFFQNSPPSNALDNELWFDSNSDKLYVFSNGAFRLIGPSGDSRTRVIGETIIDTNDNQHYVLKFYVDNINLAIASVDPAFEPKTTPLGFASSTLIQPGINLGDDPNWQLIFNGVSARSQALVDGTTVITANKLLRNDRDGVISGSLRLDGGLTIGPTGTGQINLDSNNNLRFINNIANRDIEIKTTNGSGLQNTITVKGQSQRVGINVSNPVDTLDVNGTARISGLTTFLTTPVGVTPPTPDSSTKLATTAYVKAQLVDTALTGYPTATVLSRTETIQNRIATVGYVRSQFTDTILLGRPTAPLIGNIQLSDDQVANAKFVQDVVTGRLSNTVNIGELNALTSRVTSLEGNRAFRAGDTHTGAHSFTGTIEVPAPLAALQAVNKSYADARYAPLNSPVLTGTPQSTTPAVSDDSTRIATTAWVRDQGYAAGLSGITIQDEGVVTGTTAGVTTMNFVGTGVNVTGSGNSVDINIAAGAGTIPAGLITMWYGSAVTVPGGWAICDGTNGTPDLRDRFVVGAGLNYGNGVTGGTTSYTSASAGSHNHTGAVGDTALTVGQLPAHTHNYWAAPTSANIASGGGKTIDWGLQGSYQTNVAANNVNSGFQFIQDTGNGETHTHTISSDGSHSHTISSVVPPYYALYYIMKL